jgi:hypothetical protein
MNATTAAGKIEFFGELRCGRCTSRVSADDVGCPHCGLAFEDSPRRPEPAPSGSLKGLRPMPVRTVACAVWMLAALGGLAWSLGGGEASEAVSAEVECQVCLQEIRTLLSGLEGKAGPDRTGTEFWAEAARLSGRSAPEGCPAAGTPYRGPTQAWDRIPANGVVACDPDGAHPDGLRYLTKDGRILLAMPGTPEHAWALAATKAD